MRIPSIIKTISIGCMISALPISTNRAFAQTEEIDDFIVVTAPPEGTSEKGVLAGAPNPNRSYRECLNRTQECFRKRTDLCATFDGVGHTYKDLCSGPFVKANPLS